MHRKIVEYLVMGKPHRWIKQQLGVGAGRLAKVQALAQAHGYLSGQAMPVTDRHKGAGDDRHNGATNLVGKTDIPEGLRMCGFGAVRNPCGSPGGRDLGVA